MNKIISRGLLISLLAASTSALALNPIYIDDLELNDPSLLFGNDEEQAAEAAAELVILESLTNALDDENTVVKNVVTTATGNVLDNDKWTENNVVTASLTSPPSSSVGNLIFKSDGSYTYELINNAAEILALDQGDFISDVFTYSITSTSGHSSSATLTIRILGSSVTTKDNVEIENNNRSANATPLHQGQIIQGHLLSSRDVDWYAIPTSGDEIIHLEVCPQNSTCSENVPIVGQVFEGVETFKRNWVTFVFDGDTLTRTMENAVIPLDLTRDDTGQILARSLSDNFYLKYASGVFDASLIGVISPCFGDTNALNIGVGEGSKTIFVAVASPLIGVDQDEEEGCGEGDLIHTKPGPSFEKTVTDDEGKSKTEEVTTTQEFILSRYSDDQYSLTVTGTGVDPLLDKERDYATYNPEDGSVIIPEVRIGKNLFAADLLLQKNTAKSTEPSLKLILQTLTQLDYELSGDPYQSTYNPTNRRVFIPQVVNSKTDKIYSVTLQYHPGKDGNSGWLEVIEIDEVI